MREEDAPSRSISCFYCAATLLALCISTRGDRQTLFIFNTASWWKSRDEKSTVEARFNIAQKEVQKQTAATYKRWCVSPQHCACCKSPKISINRALVVSGSRYQKKHKAYSLPINGVWKHALIKSLESTHWLYSTAKSFNWGNDFCNVFDSRRQVMANDQSLP